MNKKRYNTSKTSILNRRFLEYNKELFVEKGCHKMS